MLAATHLLLTDDAPFMLRVLACRAVSTSGGPEDAQALLTRMLVAPDELLCWSLMALGTRETGEQLLKTFIVDGALRAGAPAAVLQALGYLGVEEAEPTLWAAAHADDYYLQQSACLGLVDLPCTGRAGAIADAIRACYGRNLFGEFWPALAGKVGDPSLLDPFIADDAPTSTDCFGGVLLGLALVGARETFERVLFDPLWEATNGATGNLRWCALAVRSLGMSICELLQSRRAALGESELQVFAALVCSHAMPSPYPGLRVAQRPGDDDLALYRECITDHSLGDAVRQLDRTRPGGARELVYTLDEACAALTTRVTEQLARPITR
jgi:hypothetical protein